jgi:hypothetical protein
MSEEMFTISEKLYKLLTDHIQSKCPNKNCCITRLLKNLELK